MTANATANPVLAQIIPLTEAERLAAREAARRNVIRAYGERPDLESYQPDTPQPQRASFDQAAIAEYPRWVQRAIAAMLLISFAGAFVMSSFAVFSAGRDHWLAAFQVGQGMALTVPPQDVAGWQAPVVGIATVALAEFLVITSVLAARVYLAGRWRWQIIMALPALAGFVLAVTLNAVISQPNTWAEWLLTVIPPGATVFLALIAEQVILVDVRRRKTNENAFRRATLEWLNKKQDGEHAHADAVRAWEKTIANPEAAPRWPQALANAYREALTRANGAGRGATERRELMAHLTAHDWRDLVARELANDEWWSEPARPTLAPQGQPDQSQPQVALITVPAWPEWNQNHNGNGKPVELTR